MPTIRLIALDLDGTLLDPSERISPASRAAVTAARQQGVRVVIVTGRGSDDPLEIARDLGLTDPLICAHGALTKAVPSGRELRHVAIPGEAAAPLIQFAHEHDLDVAVYVDERFHRREGGKRYMADMTGPSWVEVPNLHALAEREPTFIRFFGHESVEKVRGRFSDHPVHFKHETWLDFEELAITSLDATKERALAELCSDLNVEARHVLAIGDSRNDLPMLHWAGVGVAMANALDEVREAAPHLTASNGEDGVARAIERFVLEPRKREKRSA
ncbi:MAG TPA: Cof-type HAD-IIB family hydrolase [Candidatus Acidoferrales bacterium]|nr:Cof-type HAD-IIB family hydrolase [Candidatus Acidoferrales bacterium]